MGVRDGGEAFNDHRKANGMYKKGTALELQFSPARLNDGAGDPYWIDLTEAEARDLYDRLASPLDCETILSHVMTRVGCIARRRSAIATRGSEQNPAAARRWFLKTA